MFVIPSIDILNGKCVQLINGKIETATIYGSPKEYYKKWIEYIQVIQGRNFVIL